MTSMTPASSVDVEMWEIMNKKGKHFVVQATLCKEHLTKVCHSPFPTLDVWEGCCSKCWACDEVGTAVQTVADASISGSKKKRRPFVFLPVPV